MDPVPKPAKTKKPAVVRKKKKGSMDPEPAGCPGTMHAQFVPLPAELYQPQPVENPFDDTFAAPCCEEEEDFLYLSDKEVVASDTESWAYESVETGSDTEDVTSVRYGSPSIASDDYLQGFLRRHRKGLREQPAVYTGPVLDFDDDV